MDYVRSLTSVDCLILACTELPLILSPERIYQENLGGMVVLDPLDVLAEEIVRLTEASKC